MGSVKVSRKVGGSAGNRGKGRKKGVPNKLTSTAKEAFALAFQGIGGAKALTTWAQENQTEFFKLYARLIPTEVSGEGGGPVSIRVVYEDVRP